MKSSIKLLLGFLCLFQSCNQNTKLTYNKPLKPQQPKDETTYLVKLENFKSKLIMTGNPFIKDSIINSFNKYANDSVKQVKNWVMVADGINESYLAGTKLYVLNLEASINKDTPGISLTVDTISGTKISEKFIEVFPPMSKLKSVNKIFNSIKALLHGDTVIVSGHPGCRTKDGKEDYSSLGNMLGGDLIFNITEIKKKK